jgi:hypothetical protein
VLPACRRRGIRVVTNAGAANPVAAATLVQAIARDLGLTGLRVAAVLGDDVLALARDGGLRDANGAVFEPPRDVLSANAYLGAEGIVDALAGGADVVVTGRVADPSLFLAPLVHELGWPTSPAWAFRSERSRRTERRRSPSFRTRAGA